MSYKRDLPNSRFRGTRAGMPDGSVRLSVTFSEDDFEVVERIADAGRDTLSGAVVKLVKEALAARRERAA